MSKKVKLSQSELDGVQYRSAKLWQIILYCCNCICGMTMYSLMNQVSYAASVGFGIGTVTIGAIMTGMRVLDGVTDPLLALLYDRVNTPFGKLRVLIMGGFVVEAIAVWLMFDGMSSKGFGMLPFILLYVVYVLGYTVINMTIQTIPALMTNDPKQRPTLGVWGTAFNYLVPMAFSIFTSAVLQNVCGGEYTQTYLTIVVRVTLVLGLVGNLLCCIGISEYDKPENFRGVSAKTKPLSMKDMLEVLAHNKPLQRYIAAAASDKLAQIVSSQSVITTLLYGIMIGNMLMSTILGVVAMLPSILFAAFGAKYAGKHGSAKAIYNWTAACIVVGVVMTVFMLVVDTRSIASVGVTMVLYVLLTLVLNGCKMCVTTANTAYMADCIDYELDRSGQYIPAVVAGTYSLMDKLITSCGALLATVAVSLIGYKDTLPNANDELTTGVVAVALITMYGLPIIGWIITLIAMKNCEITKEEMVNVQKRIAEKKAALQAESNS